MLAIVAAARHLRSSGVSRESSPAAISILKPLSGLDDGLEANLRSYFEQDYKSFELLFAVKHAWDPAADLVHQLILEYSTVRARLLVTGEPPYPHAKVFSLQCMLDQSDFDLIAMCDSDVRVGPDFCTRLSDEFSDPVLGLVTCPYRAIAGHTVWSQLEAVGMNTDFHAGLFTAVMMEGTKFAVGPTIVARKCVLQALGGIHRVKDYLAEDYMLGRLAAGLGCDVRLSPYVVEHRIGGEGLVDNFSHRIRWARSSRRSRPWGYVGQFFTHPLPVGLILLCAMPYHWSLFLLTCLLRIGSAWIVSNRILKADVNWGLLPLQDLLGFGFWIAGFFGKSIRWRGQRFTLNRDGTIQLSDKEALASRVG